MPGLLAFIRDLSEVSDVPQRDCKKVLDGVSKVLVKHVKATGTCSIPNVLRVKKVVTKARPAGARKAVGKVVEVGARPERQRLRISPLKKFKDQTLSQ